VGVNFRHPVRHVAQASRPRTGLARALSKLGYCSRSQGWEFVEAGRVRVNGTVRLDPEWRVDVERDHIEVDQTRVQKTDKVYIMLNKPRGLVTTTSDEQGRETVFACLRDKGLPFISPVGRLDKASEGVLLFTNDTAWAAHLTAPESHIEKVYHVQVDCLADETLFQRLREGVSSEGEILKVRKVSLLRQGERNSWLEIVLDEGKNRHIRRMLETLKVQVLRLIRISVGPLVLGNLPKGDSRRLTADEVRMLGAL
jgi:23S rRNA pseudouridine2605 synthase